MMTKAPRYLSSLPCVLLFLTVLSGFILLPATASANETQIKNNIIERLKDRAERLARVDAQGAGVRAALERSNHFEFMDVLRRFASEGSAYATAALDDIKAENPAQFDPNLSPDFKDLVTASNYRTKFLECLSKGVSAKLAKNVDHIQDAIEKLETAPAEDVPSVIRNMLKNLKDDVAPESLSKCILGEEAPEFLPGQDDLISVEWNSQCLVSERVNPDGTTPLTRPTVASILYDNGRDGPQAFCTGTLVAPNIVITAAHCFCLTAAKQPGGRFLRTAAECRRGAFLRQGSVQAAVDPRHHSVFFQHAGIFNVTDVIIHPKFRWTGRLPFADLTLLVLEKPVFDITPTPVNSISRLRPGAVGTGVGYGYFRPILSNGRPSDTFEIQRETGLKLEGRIITDRCPRLVQKRGMICWSYRRQRRGLSLGSTCLGDSGGPLFAEHRSQTFLVGVTSAGDRNCALGSRAFDIEVFRFHEWIDETVRQRGIPVLSPVLRVQAEQRKCILCDICETDETTASGIRSEIEINSSTARRMRVSINCTPGLSDEPLGLSLRNLSEQSPAVCPPKVRTTVQSCEVPVVRGQKWKIDIEGGIDRQCQIVATTFDRPPPVPDIGRVR